MRLFQQKYLVFIVLSLAIVFAIPASQAFAEGYAKDGIYIGPVLHYNSIEDRDFDGERYIYGSGVAAIVPKITRGNGAGFVIGFRNSSKDGSSGAFEISYIRSKHDASWLNATGKAEMNTVNLDLKPYFLPDSPLQPYLQFGLCIPWLVVKEGGVYSGSSVDAKYFSHFLIGGANFGGGFSVYPVPRIALSAGFVYRLIWFNRAKIGGTVGGMEDALSGSGLNFNTALTFTF